MKIETGPYEILLRFNCEIGESFGHLRGCHRIMQSYLVDDSGNISGRVETNEQPKDFPPQELAKYLGDQFAAFETQLSSAQAQIAELTAANGKLASDLGEMTMSRDAHSEQLVAKHTKLSETEKTLAGARSKLSLNEARLAATQDRLKEAITAKVAADAASREQT